jgi:WD40 repeat protein
LIFTVREGKEVEFHQQLNIHVKATGDEVPITCLSADEDGRLASGNERGGVIIWRDPSASRTQEILAFIRCDDQTSCIQLGWLRDLIAIGYDNGKVSICTSGGMRLTTINAHSRSIMDVDIATDTGLMLTVSEDSTFSVWKIAGNKQLKVTLVHTGVVSNSLLTGGRFCDNEGTTFGLSCDSTNIIEY